MRPSRPHLELQLDTSPLTRAETRAISSMGGTYTECRGDSRTRFVHVPATARGVQLATRLIQAHARTGSCTVITRRFPRLADMVIMKARTAEQVMNTLRARARASFAAGKLPRPATAAERHTARIQDLQRSLARARAQVTAYEIELATLTQRGTEP